MSRVDLHKIAKLSSVYQRWDQQLLMIMYDESRRVENIIEPVHATRQALKLNFYSINYTIRNISTLPTLGVNIFGINYLVKLRNYHVK